MGTHLGTLHEDKVCDRDSQKKISLFIIEKTEDRDRERKLKKVKKNEEKNKK